MKKWLRLANFLEKINSFFAILARWAVLLMLALGFWNVIGRYLGVAVGHNLSSNVLIESQWYLFDIIFLLGLGWTLQQQNHVRVDVLQGRWNNNKKAKIELLGTIFLLLPFAIGVTIISIKPAIYSWLISESSPDPNGLPRYWVKTLIPLSFFLLSLQGSAEAIKNWAKLKSISFSKNSMNKHNQHYFD